MHIGGLGPVVAYAQYYLHEYPSVGLSTKGAIRKADRIRLKPRGLFRWLHNNRNIEFK